MSEKGVFRRIEDWDYLHWSIGPFSITLMGRELACADDGRHLLRANKGDWMVREWNLRDAVTVADAQLMSAEWAGEQFARWAKEADEMRYKKKPLTGISAAMSDEPLTVEEAKAWAERGGEVMSRIKLPIRSAPNRERIVHDMWGEPIDGIEGRVCDGEGRYVTYSLDSLVECIMRHGGEVLAMDPSSWSDDVVFWVEWKDREVTLPPGFKRDLMWRDLE